MALRNQEQTFVSATGINPMVSRKGGVFVVPESKLVLKPTDEDKKAFEKLKLAAANKKSKADKEP